MLDSLCKFIFWIWTAIRTEWKPASLMLPFKYHAIFKRNIFFIGRKTFFNIGWKFKPEENIISVYQMFTITRFTKIKFLLLYYKTTLMLQMLGFKLLQLITPIRMATNPKIKDSIPTCVFPKWSYWHLLKCLWKQSL